MNKPSKFEDSAADLETLTAPELMDLNRRLLRENGRLRDELETAGLYREMMDDVSEAIVVYDESGCLLTCNKNFLDLYGYSAAQAHIGAHYSELGKIDVEKGNVAVGDEFGDDEEYLKRKEEYRKRLAGSFIVKLRDGRWIKTTDRPMSRGGFVSVQVDISDIKALEERMSELACHDPLTSLVNRRFFAEKARDCVANALRSGFPLAVIFIDLDDFKAVNDEYGHNIGDQVLIEVAGRLKHRLRQSDVIARFGGDEFVVLLSDKEAAHGATQVADSLIKELSKPYLLNDLTINIGASIGISFMPCNSEDLNTMLIAADKALYAAKQAGRGRWFKYDEVEHDQE